MTVAKAMAMLFFIPLALEKVPGLRLMSESVEKPERSSVLLRPFSQIVTIGCVLTLKS
jgi:hypothetical protein